MYIIKKILTGLGIAAITSVVAIIGVQIHTRADVKTQIQIPGVEIKESTESVKLDKKSAIAKAKEIYTDKEASSITTELCRFTDDSNNLLQKNILVWIVAFHDVTIPHHEKWSPVGGYPATAKYRGDMNVIINANTGEYVETVPNYHK